jgi:putative membrane protein
MNMWREIVFAISTSWLVPGLALAQERYEWGWGMHPMWGMWGIGMMLMMLIFWVLFVAALVLAVRWLLRDQKRRGDSALEILRQRYARGEINKEEFESKKKDLS